MKSFAPPYMPHAKGHETVAASDQGKTCRAMPKQAKQQPNGNRQAADGKVGGQHAEASEPDASLGWGGCWDTGGALAWCNTDMAERMAS